MTKEELLKPRWKVIADYPTSLFEKNQIVKGSQFLDERIGTGYYFQYENYPAIFQRLDWWEERSKDELPEYLKYTHLGETDIVKQFYIIDNRVYLNEQDLDNGNYYYLHEFLPSTKEEYNELYNH